MKNKWKWAGHIARRDNIKWTKNNKVERIEKGVDP